MASPQYGNILSAQNYSASNELQEFSWKDPFQRHAVILLGLLLVGLVAVYRDLFELLTIEWKSDQYSHGWLIPVFTLVMLVLRRKAIQEVPAQERWIGVGVLALGMGLRLFAGWKYWNSLDMISLYVSIFGVFMTVGGIQILRWAGAWIAFLIFMFPLPYFLENTLLMNLKKVATVCSTFLLQTMGFAAYRQGQVITIGNAQVTVADVCSGLRMATILVAMSVAFALVIQRPWWDKLIILVLAVPNAIFANMVRITATAITYWITDDEDIRHTVHDWAGLVMPIIALGVMMLEMAILERLTIIEEDDSAFKVGVPGRGMRVPT